MKRLVLALLIAMGVANTNAAINADVISSNISTLNLDSTEKTTILEWIKQHPALVSAAVVTTVALVYGGVDHFKNDGAHRKAASDKIKAGCTKLKDGFVASKDTVMHPIDNIYTPAKNFVIQDWKHIAGTSIVTLATLAVVGYAVYDIAQKDKSKIKKTFKKFFGKKETKEEVAA